MTTLLAQLLEDVPGSGHQQRVHYTGDVAEAHRIVRRATEELNVGSIRFLLKLERFELQPELNDPKRAAYDVLMAGLSELRPRLAELPAVG